MSYQGAASFNEGLSLFTGNNPGLSYAQNFATLGIGNQAFTFSSPNLPVPLPAPTTVKPLAVEPFDIRTNRSRPSMTIASILTSRTTTSNSARAGE
jgi:hypothetical protein